MREKEEPTPKKKRYTGNSLETILRIRAKNMDKLLKSPYIGAGVATFEEGRFKYRVLVIHLNRSLLPHELNEPNYYRGVRAKYISDGINVKS